MGQIEDGLRCMYSETGTKKGLSGKEERKEKSARGDEKDVLVLVKYVGSTRSAQSQWQGGAAQPSGAQRGQNSIPLPLLSFATFALPPAGAPPPPDDVSAENGLRCDAAFVCWGAPVS